MTSNGPLETGRFVDAAEGEEATSVAERVEGRYYPIRSRVITHDDGRSDPDDVATESRKVVKFAQSMYDRTARGAPDPTTRSGIDLSQSFGLNPRGSNDREAEGACRHQVPGDSCGNGS